MLIDVITDLYPSIQQYNIQDDLEGILKTFNDVDHQKLLSKGLLAEELIELFISAPDFYTQKVLNDLLSDKPDVISALLDKTNDNKLKYKLQNIPSLLSNFNKINYTATICCS